MSMEVSRPWIAISSAIFYGVVAVAMNFINKYTMTVCLLT
jgi:hypothetical protein